MSSFNTENFNAQRHIYNLRDLGFYGLKDGDSEHIDTLTKDDIETMVAQYPKLIGLFEFLEHNKESFDTDLNNQNDFKSKYEKSIELDNIFDLLMIDESIVPK